MSRYLRADYRPCFTSHPVTRLGKKDRGMMRMRICTTLVAMAIVSRCTTVVSQSCDIPACPYEDAVKFGGPSRSWRNHSHAQNAQKRYCASLAVFFDCIYNSDPQTQSTCPATKTACLGARAVCPQSFERCGCSIDYCNPGLVYKHFGACGEQGTEYTPDCELFSLLH